MFFFFLSLTMTDEEFGSLEQQHWTLNDQVCRAIFILIRCVNLQFDTLQMTHFKWTHNCYSTSNIPGVSDSRTFLHLAGGR